jgi:hypothetical protein
VKKAPLPLLVGVHLQVLVRGAVDGSSLDLDNDRIGVYLTQDFDGAHDPSRSLNGDAKVSPFTS